MLYPHPEPLSLRQTTANLSLHRRRSNTVLWVLVCTRFLFFNYIFFCFFFLHNVSLRPLSISGRNGVWFEHEFAPPTILLGLLLCLWTWGISSQPLQCPLFYWSFSDLGHGVCPQGQSSEAQTPLLTLDMGYLLTAVAPDLAPELQASGREWDLNTESYQLGRHLWGEVTWNFKWWNMKFCFLIQPVDWIHVLIDTFKLIHSVIKHLLSPYCISGTF